MNKIQSSCFLATPAKLADFDTPLTIVNVTVVELKLSFELVIIAKLNEEEFQF
jgi:hypothetical protein